MNLKDYKKRCYNSGKISGLQDWYVDKKFSQYDKKIERKGLIPVSPLTENNYPYWIFMLRDIFILLTCKNVAMQHDWKDSRGAKIERIVALLTFKKIIYLKVALIK